MQKDHKVPDKSKRTWKHVKKRAPKARKTPLPVEGSEIDPMQAERLSPIVRRAHELRATGFYLWEIAEKLKKQFGVNPTLPTISRWFAAAHEIYLADIKNFQAQRVFAALERCERMRRKYLPIAVADQLSILRKKKVDGETVEYLSEDAFSEQAKAAEIVLKTEVIEADILGYKGGMALMSENDKGQTMADLFAYMHRLATRNLTQDGDLSDMPVLLMRSGLENEEQIK